MKRYFVLISLLLFCLGTFAAEFSTKGGNGILYETPSSINGDVYIFSENTDGVQLEFSVEDSTSFSWFEYKSDPAEALKLTENISISDDGKSSILSKVRENYGYFVEYEYKKMVCTEDEEGEEQCEEVTQTAKKYVWIAIYEPMKTVTWEEGVVCEYLKLYIEPEMGYVLADNFGYRKTGSIERNLKIVYSTFKREGNNPPDVQEVSENHSAATVVNVNVPYVDTDFTITDQLGVKLNIGAASEIVTDSVYKTFAVIAFPAMTVEDKEANEVDPNNNWDKDASGNVRVYFSGVLDESTKAEFRTSAPLHVSFAHNRSEKVDRFVWQISRNPDFTTGIPYVNVDLNNFIFEELGVHYIRLSVFGESDSLGKFCEYTAYACLEISESGVWVPNVFTPNGDNVNDVFKVAYKSIASYRCRIYNQWGKMVYDSTDITQGWDGKIGGRDASIGAYYYVIDAKGTDGKVHKKRGDINLVRSK